MSTTDTTLSLCMIIKNEENYLERCLESVKGVIDEIIIVDTGSTDNSIKIAKKYTDNIYNFKWNNNFAEARNFSICKASGDWIMIMDADEELHKEDKDKLNEIIKNNPGEALEVKILNQLEIGGFIQQVVHKYPRIFKNNSAYRFSGAIHEQITPSIMEHNPSAKIISSDIRIFHYGYNPDINKKKDKSNRNIEILEKLLREEPDNPFHKYNLGITYSASAQYKKAKSIFHELYQEINFNRSYTHYLIKNLANVHIQLKEYNEALEILNTGINFYPEYTDLYYLKGHLYFLLNKYKKAIKFFNTCLQLGDSDDRYISNIGTGSFYALLEMGLCLEKMGHYNQALNTYVRAVQINPAFHKPIHACVQCLTKMGKNMEEIKGWLGQTFNFNQPLDEIIKIAE